MDNGISRINEPAAKRPRLLACKRCRNRKQRCDDSRPCSNCQKGGQHCEPMDPVPRLHVEADYVRALEERVAELESLDPQQSLDHMLHRLSQEKRPSEASEATPDTSNELPINGQHARSIEFLNTLSAVDDSSEAFHPLILGLATSPTTHQSDHNGSKSGQSPQIPRTTLASTPQTLHALVAGMPRDAEELLLSAYRDRAQAQWPFFHWDTFLSWHFDWKNSPSAESGSTAWHGFFVNLVYATSFLLLPLASIGNTDANTFYRHGMALLPAVLKQDNPILQVQAYLLLSMHALHDSSTERILSLSSTAMGYCIQRQFHLLETEPVPVTTAVRLENQIRRRCFWSAYGLNRLVVASFDLPPSIADIMITAKLYTNIDDEDLLDLASRIPPDKELPDSPEYTCVSSALHILQCRRIQSEISSYTLRWDYPLQFEKTLDWRIRIVSELESYKSRVRNFSDAQSKGHTSQRWLAMIYHYTLLMLYRPTKDSVTGPAGDWSVQASSQACLIFRRSQMDRQIAQSWIGILVQFQSGITLLYCFWATPPEQRTESYDSPEVSDGLRACSNILAILADRWPKADCLRDVFELLAREVPLVDRPSRPPTKISEKSAAAIRKRLPQVEALLSHRSTMRMINEMVSEDFPRLRDKSRNEDGPPRPPAVAGMLSKLPPQHSRGQGSSDTSVLRPYHDVSLGMPFEMPFSAHTIFDDTAMELPDLGSDALLAFPSMYDSDAWS